jgi:hypothetical protein
MSTDSNATVAKYLAEHARLIEQRQTVAGSGRKAAAARALGLCELELTLLGADFVAYVAESASAQSLVDLSEDALRTAHADLIAKRMSPDVGGPGHKASLVRSARRYEGELQRRGLDFTPWRNHSPAHSMSDSALMDRLNAITELLNRTDVRPSLAKVGARELATLTTLAESRGLILAPSDDDAPVASPPVDTGALLDAVVASVASDANAVTTSRKGRKSTSVAA